MTRLRSHRSSTLGEKLVLMVELPLLALMLIAVKFTYDVIAVSF